MKQVPSDLYDEDYYKKYNHGFEQFQQEFGMLEEFQDFLKKNINKGDKVLDVGCGRGELLWLCEQIDAKAWGIDYSETAVKIARKTVLKYMKIKEVDKRILKMDAKKLDFDSNSFDIVVMMDIVEHLYPEELTLAISEAFRVLKKEGRLLVHTSPNKLNMQIIRKVAHWFGVNLISEKYHVNEQSPLNLKFVLEKKFQILNVNLVKDKKYFSKQMNERGKLLKFISKIFDWVLDSKVVVKIVELPFFLRYFATDIYITAKKSQSNHA